MNFVNTLNFTDKDLLIENTRLFVRLRRVNKILWHALLDQPFFGLFFTSHHFDRIEKINVFNVECFTLARSHFHLFSICIMCVSILFFRYSCPVFDVVYLLMKQIVRVC